MSTSLGLPVGTERVTLRLRAFEKWWAFKNASRKALWEL
ncbi:hypothetical protein C365_01375 [Cryptococcus neoformans Bt85]|nr:hypothetical protein C365_01375 [Cryptococcus neoformans var. grubii Bt85]